MRLRELAGRRVAIWGLGLEGRAVLAALRRALPEQPVTLIDEAADAALAADLAADPRLSLDLSRPVGDRLTGFDVVVKSPGISAYRSEVLDAKSKGVTFTSATSIWFAQNPDAMTIAITGTKGKSTTAALVAHLLEAQGMRVALAGNIGLPLVELLEQTTRPDVYVLELSSYQTSDLDRGPRVGVLLNLYPEHLDWHGDVATYYRDKVNLLVCQEGGWSIVNGANADAVRLTAKLRSERVLFDVEAGFHVADGAIARAGLRVLAVERVPLRGAHNLSNLCAALSAVECAGGDPARCGAAIEHFAPLPHRLQELGLHAGQRFVDDSISTIPQATIAAIESFPGHDLCVLLGGFDRGVDYRPLADYLVARGRVAAITMGGSGPRIAETIRQACSAAGAGGLEVEEAEDLAEAVAAARRIAPSGAVVLLSPAAPTGSEFPSFRERGQAFQRQVSGTGH